LVGTLSKPIGVGWKNEVLRLMSVRVGSGGVAGEIKVFETADAAPKLVESDK
jgi:hypothetical protein